MDDDGAGGDVGGSWVSTVRVASELVRSNAVPQLEGWAALLRDRLTTDEMAGGTLAIRQMDHIVTTAQGADLASLDLESFVEVVDYDPVRHVAMVIGLRDAPRSIPLVWLLLRVFPGAEGMAVLPGRKGVAPREVRRTPRGTFEEAFAIGETMAGRGREGVLGPAMASFERVGTILVVPPRGDPVAVLELAGGGD